MKSISLNHWLPRRNLNSLHFKMCACTHTYTHTYIITEPYILGPLNNSRASIITCLSQLLPALTKRKSLILDISNISEKQILQAPAHGNLNHRMENTTFYPIKPHKPQIFLNLCLPKHPHSFLCFPQSATSLLLKKCNQNYLQ